MTSYPSDIAFTQSVKRLQSEKGSREAYARMEQGTGWRTTVDEELVEFLRTTDMFYLGTSNDENQPYIQYRGGPPGFLKAIGSKELAFADFSGNRQYISLGNLSENSKAFIFLMDYVNRRRIKIWGHARYVEDDPQLLSQLSHEDYPAEVERAIIFEIDAWDRNCPQHIHQRIPARAVNEEVEKLQSRIQSLERQLQKLQANQ